MFNLLFNFLKLHHVGVFVVHVEEIDLVRQRTAIKDAFFNDRHVIAQRVSIDAAGTYAAAGAFAADDQTVDAELRQMSDERRAEKAAGTFLENDHIARFGFELFLDLECLRIDLDPLAIGRMNGAGFRFFAGFGGRIKDRDFQ